MKSSLWLRYCLALILLAGMLAVASAQSGRKRQVNPPPNQTESETQKPQSDQTSRQRPSADKPVVDNSPVTVGDDGTIKLDTTLVTIPVSVTDRNGKFAPFLTKRDFQIYEDGVEQQIESFESVETPFNVVLMLDTSNSTRFRLEDIQEAAVSFINELRPDDRVMVVSFDSNYRIECDFTSERYVLRRAIYQTRTGGSTKLYETMEFVVGQLDRIDGRKAIVLFTDGVDTSSRRATARSTLEQVEESGALVYPISYDTEEYGGGGGVIIGNPRGTPPIINYPWPFPLPRNPRRPRWPFDRFVNFQFPGQYPQGRVPGGGRGDYQKAAQYLQELADRSGGRLYRAENLGNVSQAFSMIAEELRHQYALSYYPGNTAKDGTYRKIRVRVNQAGMVVRAREGYRAAGETHASSDDKDDGRPVLKRKQLAEN